MKKAYLVYTSFITRVVAEEDACEEELAELAGEGIIEKIANGETLENLENIIDDTEVPYDEEYDK